MFLILEISSSNASALGAAARAVFSVKGGSIGRRAGNDWVLADPHVSGRHARVRSVGGTFFLEDAESANGVLVNGTKLHPGEPFPLKEGDQVFIDPFDISVRITTTMPGAVTQVLAVVGPREPEPGVADAARGRRPAFRLACPARRACLTRSRGRQRCAAGAVGIRRSDRHGYGRHSRRLQSTAGNASRRALPCHGPPTGRDLVGRPVINDAIDIRTPPLAPPAAGGSAIPTNWDAADVPVRSEPPVPPPSAAPAVPAPAPRVVSPPRVAAAPTPSSSGAYSSDFDSLLRGAGMPEGSLSPEAMAELGQVLRIVVEGLMEVLRARGEIKNEFRLQQTTFKSRENNPLKFSANVEDALHNLLVKRNPAYLDAPAAFADAFADVRAHQMAILAGMRAAFDYMLGRFSPEALRAQFDARPGRKASLGFGAAGRQLGELRGIPQGTHRGRGRLLPSPVWRPVCPLVRRTIETNAGAQAT